jgi:hypothetical protein
MTPPAHVFLSLPLRPAAHLDINQALTHADALLRCAGAVAYESADQHTGEARHLALTVVHLVDMARSLVVHGLESDTLNPGGEVAKTDG